MTGRCSPRKSGAPGGRTCRQGQESKQKEENGEQEQHRGLEATARTRELGSNRRMAEVGREERQEVAAAILVTNAHGLLPSVPGNLRDSKFKSVCQNGDPEPSHSRE